MSKTYEENRKGTRTRNWTFIVYPESAPENWREEINATHVAWVESPLHDMDIEENGTEEKKAHWHVLLLFESIKTYEQAKIITDSVNATIPIMVNSTKGLVRYMVHMDSPNKFQYKVEDIKCHGGANIADLLAPTKTERYGLIREMQIYVKREKITEFGDLLDYAMEERFSDWYPLLCDNSAFVMEKYIKTIWRRATRENDRRAEIAEQVRDAAVSRLQSEELAGASRVAQLKSMDKKIVELQEEIKELERKKREAVADGRADEEANGKNEGENE